MLIISLLTTLFSFTPTIVKEGQRSLPHNIISFLKKGKLKFNQRLACQAIVTKDNKVFISNFGRYTILTDTVITASCAAGGAYEGYQISCGVGAIEGAITKLKIENSHIDYETLGNKSPLGVCGSGVIDLLAIIAKAGLRTDQDLLIKYYGTSPDKISKIYLTGAFGNYMNIENAIYIGLLPKTDKDKFIRFGNGALAGAIDMLISRETRNDAENLRNLIEHKKPNEIEGKKFQYMLAENMYFPIK